MTYTKHTKPILPAKNFFKYKIILKNYTDSIKTVQNIIKTSTIISYQIFNEFTEPDIQKNINYNDKNFYIFNIIITTKNNDMTYINNYIIKSFYNTFKFKITPLLNHDKFKKLIKLPNNLNSIIQNYNFTINHTELINTNKYI